MATSRFCGRTLSGAVVQQPIKTDVLRSYFGSSLTEGTSLVAVLSHHTMLTSFVIATLALNCHARVPHAEPKLPSDWSYHNPSFSSITFRLSLKQPGAQKLIQIAKRVSDPSDRMYGKYWLRKGSVSHLLVLPRSTEPESSSPRR